jgi:carbamoyltransferase
VSLFPGFIFVWKRGRGTEHLFLICIHPLSLIYRDLTELREAMYLGLHLLGHDIGFALVDSDGKLQFLGEEERYSRKKRGRFALSPNLLLQALADEGIASGSIQGIVVVGQPELWTANLNTQILGFDPLARERHLQFWVAHYTTLFRQVDHIDRIRHHHAHAASAYFPSGFSESAVLTVDAFGDGEVCTIWRASGLTLTKLYAESFPFSVCRLYDSFATAVGLFGADRAGQLMALAAHGSPIYLSKLRELFFQGSRMKEFFRRIPNDSRAWALKIKELLPDLKQIDGASLNGAENYAASMQALFEHEVLRLVVLARKYVPSSNLCCAGGGFLNCKLNGRIWAESGFINHYIQPLAGDSGLALGAAYISAISEGCKPQKLDHLFKSSKLWNLDLDQKLDLLKRNGFNPVITDTLPEEIAEHIARGSIVAWCQGAMEIGPRALGHRSLLARVDSLETSQRVNEIKTRLPWRPFGPSLLADDLKGCGVPAGALSFMNVAVSTEAKDLKGVTALDGSIRPQVVDRMIQPSYHELLTCVKRLTGRSAVLNTSLNLKNEVVPRTIDDFISSAVKLNVDFIAFDESLLIARPKNHRSTDFSNKNNLRCRNHVWNFADRTQLDGILVFEKLEFKPEVLQLFEQMASEVHFASLADTLDPKQSKLKEVLDRISNDRLAFIIATPCFAAAFLSELPSLVVSLQESNIELVKVMDVDLNVLEFSVKDLVIVRSTSIDTDTEKHFIHQSRKTSDGLKESLASG